MKTAYGLLRPLCFFVSFLFCTTISKAQTTSQAIDLNGLNGFANLGTINPAGNFSSGLTIECWVKWDAFANWSRLLDMGNGPGSNNILLANQGLNAKLRFEVYHNGGQTGITSPVIMTPGEWYHVAVTQNNTGWATMFINGTEVVSGAVQIPQNVIRNMCYIGKSNWVEDGYLDGQVDDVRIWNVTRTPTEIRQHIFKPVASNAAGLVAYYQFNEGSGTALTNFATNGGAGNATAVGSFSRVSSPVQFAANALSLDGVNDYVSFTPFTEEPDEEEPWIEEPWMDDPWYHDPMFFESSLAESFSYTKEAWVYATTTSGARNVVSSQGSPLWIAAGQLMAGNNGPVPAVTDPGTFPTNTWVHVAVSYNAVTGLMSLYRNGNLVSEGPATPNTTGEINYIGAWFNGTATESFLEGKIDEVRIWDVVRSREQIQAAMNRELNLASETGLVSYYSFNQGIAGGNNAGMHTIIDLTGTSNITMTNLALNGATSNFVSQQGALVVLPVRLVTFTAHSQGSNVLLQWSTASEHNALDFMVQHSTDGRFWAALDVVAAAGNSSSVRNYQYVHSAPAPGNNYYRLLQRDADGKSSLSPVRTVSFKEVVKTFTLSSTVVSNGMLQVQVNSRTGLALYGADGRMLWAREYAPGRHNIEAEAPAKGVYFLKGGGVTEKIFVR